MKDVLASFLELPLPVAGLMSDLPLVEEAFLAGRTMLTPAYEVSYMTTAVGLVRAGEGVTLLPSSALELKMLSGVEIRGLTHRGFERRIGIARKAA